MSKQTPKLELLPFKAPEYLSPSSISTFRQCPQKFKYSKIDKIPDPSGKEAILGNFVHDVLEDLYGLPPELRTQQQAKELARQQWESKWRDEISALITNEKELKTFRWSAWWCIENLWALEDPQQVSPYSMESFVKGQIGGVKIHGFIDRLAVNGKSAKVSDYKTGKTPRKNYVDDKFFQLIVYSQLLSSLNVNADDKTVELLYLQDGVRFEKTVSDSDVKSTVDLIQSVKSEIDESCTTGEFEARPSALCNWCSFKTICPAWQ